MSKKMKKIPTRKIKSRALFFLPTYATVRAADKAARIIKLEATAHSQPFSAWISRIMEKRYSDRGSIYCLLRDTIILSQITVESCNTNFIKWRIRPFCRDPKLGTTERQNQERGLTTNYAGLQKEVSLFKPHSSYNALHKM